MNRLGLLPPSALQSQQKDSYDEYERQLATKRWISTHNKDDEGCLLGPAGVLIHDPDMLQHCLGLYEALSRKLQESGVPRHIEEIASLVVGSRTQAAYEIHAHSKTCGFSQRCLDEIRNGCCPVEFGEKSRLAFQIATELGTPGPLSEATWNKSVNTLGVDGTTALVQCVGFYTFLSIIDNGLDVQRPTADGSQTSSTASARSSMNSVVWWE